MDSPLCCRSYRRFGAEIELNTRTGIVKRPERGSKEIPDGSEYVSRLVHKVTKKSVEIRHWQHYHNNKCWIIKPDNSCGIEVSTPVMKGWKNGLLPLLRVIDEFGKSKEITADNRCSFHLHVNLEDLSLKQRASIIGYWIKCEHLFLDAMPPFRKLNRYCQVLGLTDLFSVNSSIDSEWLIKRVSAVKYYTLNTYHMNKDRRNTIEFRIADSQCCLDPLYAKNWVRLLLHFVDCVKDRPLIPYEKGNQWSSYLWLELEDFWELMGFNEELSHGMELVRSWFVDRLLTYTCSGSFGIWSKDIRSFIVEKISHLENKQITDPVEEQIYGEKYIL